MLYPGGAALNLAVGLARLGLPSLLAARIGLDRNGFRLMRYLREEGVRLVNTPTQILPALRPRDVATANRATTSRLHVPAADRVQLGAS